MPKPRDRSKTKGLYKNEVDGDLQPAVQFYNDKQGYEDCLDLISHSGLDIKDKDAVKPYLGFLAGLRETDWLVAYGHWEIGMDPRHWLEIRGDKIFKEQYSDISTKAPF